MTVIGLPFNCDGTCFGMGGGTFSTLLLAEILFGKQAVEING